MSRKFADQVSKGGQMDHEIQMAKWLAKQKYLNPPTRPEGKHAERAAKLRSNNTTIVFLKQAKAEEKRLRKLRNRLKLDGKKVLD